MANSKTSEEIKEGFLCPTCHKDLRSPNNLLAHFQDLHSEEQDVLKSLKELVGKAKKKILKLDERDIELFKSEYAVYTYCIEQSEPQEPGFCKVHTDYFKSVRRERLDHRTTETNRLILRLDKLLKVHGSDRKLQEQKLVSWLDGTTVTRCPSCASSFNITKRQHHCRLCGSIMCNSCSEFLLYETARMIIAPKYPETDNVSSAVTKNDTDTLRICNHCMDMLECRRHVQIRQMVQLPICVLYEQLQKIRHKIQPSIDLYLKMYSSLTSGDTTFQLQDAQSLKSTLAKQAEALDTVSKSIAALPPDPECPKVHVLQNSIRRTTTQYVKDCILTLPLLPCYADLEKIKKDRLSNVEFVQHVPTVNLKRVAVTTGWSPANVTNDSVPEMSEDPIIQQMNIVRNYIEQARNAQRFEEVVSLQENLKMLKKMYRQQQIRNDIAE